MHPARPPVPFRVRRLPRPGRLNPERRQHRSQHPAEALELALGRSAERACLDVVLVVDGFGSLVASNATELDLGMLAAVAPIVGRGMAAATIKRDGQPLDLTVRPVEVDDEVLYVAAIGGALRERRREVKASCAAARRILA